MEYIGEVAKQGLLGLLLAVSVTLNFYLGKLVLAEKDKRIEAANKVRDELIEPIGYIKDYVALIAQKIKSPEER